VLEHGEYDGQPASKVLLRILTGKRHQIRLHMRYLGHPLIGDYIYTDPIDRLQTAPNHAARQIIDHSYGFRVDRCSGERSLLYTVGSEVEEDENNLSDQSVVNSVISFQK
jgi:23S rRNA-/tRNA-specific pseudouridylate synthase